MFAFIIFFKNASETELVGNILAFIFIGICITFVVLYGIDLYGLMFPN